MEHGPRPNHCSNTSLVPGFLKSANHVPHPRSSFPSFRELGDCTRERRRPGAQLARIAARHAWKAEARYSAGVAHDGGGQARVGGRCSGKVLTHELSRKRRHRAHGWKQENTPTPIYSFLPSSRKSKTRFAKGETISPTLLINTYTTSSKCLRGKFNKC